MQIFQLLAAALSGGTVLLYGMLGGIFTERSGVMNLAIEGYMLLGATISYSVAFSSGNVECLAEWAAWDICNKKNTLVFLICTPEFWTHIYELG